MITTKTTHEIADDHASKYHDTNKECVVVWIHREEFLAQLDYLMNVRWNVHCDKKIRDYLDSLFKQIEMELGVQHKTKENKK